MLSCGGLLILGLIGKSVGFVRTSTATYAGYSVDAPGIATGAKSQQLTTGVTIFNRLTGSEFLIAEKKSPQGKFTPELFLLGLGTIAQVKQQTAVSRAGLTGIHYEVEGNKSVPAHIGEVFPTTDGVLILTYMSGPALAEHNGRPPKMDTASAISRDNPDAFFASLRSSGSN
jgi:hypothetical protein